MLKFMLFTDLCFLSVCTDDWLYESVERIRQVGRRTDKLLSCCAMPRDTASSRSPCDLIAKDFWSFISLFNVLKPLSIVYLTSIVKSKKKECEENQSSGKQAQRLKVTRYLSVLDES